MEQVINFKNLVFWWDQLSLEHRLHAKLAYDGHFRIAFDNLNLNQIHNTDIELLLNFQNDAFDEKLIEIHSVTCLVKVGEKSKAVLEMIERLRFEHPLDNDGFEIDYATLALFIEFVVKSMKNWRK